MKQEIVFLPAWDKTHPDPKKNYGIHSVEMHFRLHGPLGMIQFVTYTNWHLPEVQKRLLSSRSMNEAIGGDLHWSVRPQPADLEYHSPKPMYEGQPVRHDCQYLEGGTCYYDRSALAAEAVFRILVREGSEGVWKRLQEEYDARFNS
jgi:hypothetical protein